MERQQINNLLEKYLEGKTSLAEEKNLKTYFKNTANLPPEWEEYRVLFAYFDSEKETKYEGEIYLPKERNYKKIISVAAAISVVVGFFVFQPFGNEQTNQAEGKSIQATENAKSLFMLMGSFPEESKENLEYLNELDALKIKGNDKKKDSLKSKKIEKQ